MYTEAFIQNRVICSEKMVIKLGIILMAVAVFSGSGLRIDANEGVLKYYVHEKSIKKEQENALFLLKKKWNLNLENKYGTNKIKEVADGVIYVQLKKKIGNRNIKINVAEVNRKLNPTIEIVPKLSTNNIHSRSKINNFAKDSLIAINGTYFKQDTGTPLGTLVINNKIISGPIYNRVGLAIGRNNFKTSRISFEGKLYVNGNKIKIDNINQPRMSYKNVLLYTDVWGEKSPNNKSGSRQISILNNFVVQISDKQLNIPKGGYVISAPKNIIEMIKIGDEVSIEYGINPDFKTAKHIISGGPYLMKEGNIYVDTSLQKLNAIAGRNPRTAIGYTKDNIFIMATVDGRKEGSSGVTLKELASLMKELGCYEAINLDGGSSTVMYVDGKIYTGSSVKAGVSVNNILVVKNK